MLSEPTLAYLNSLPYRPDANRRVCWLPLSGIYWDDELPSILQLANLPKDDQHQVLRLFGLRARMWRGELLQAEDKRFWDAIRLSLPCWAFFHRPSVSADDLKARESAEQAAEQVFQALIVDADEVQITENHGVQSFAATFNLAKEVAAPRKKS